MTQAAQLAQYGANNVGLSFKNRIINGDMTIDQRNSGAAVTLSEGGNNFITDRFQTYKANAGVTITGQRSTVAPLGFINSLLFTTTTGASIGAANEGQARQNIEGLNVADLAWGTANAQPVTVSFWVRSSLTGTFAVAIQSNNADAAYVSTYTISSANTFEYKTVTIVGPTSGTFPTNNTTCFSVLWDIGGGSNFNAASANTWVSGNRYTVAGTQKIMGTTGATLYITGVQLEKGTVATSFDYLPYGTELQLCQRYYQVVKAVIAVGRSSTGIGGAITVQQQMRASPTLNKTSGSIKFGDYIAIGSSTSSTPTLSTSDTLNRDKGVLFALDGFTGFTARHMYFHEVEDAATGMFTLSAEL